MQFAIGDQLARQLLAGEIRDGDTVRGGPRCHGRPADGDLRLTAESRLDMRDHVLSNQPHNLDCAERINLCSDLEDPDGLPVAGSPAGMPGQLPPGCRWPSRR